MSDHNSINDAIQASLANFTKRFDEVSSDQFNEMRKCSFFDPIPSEWLGEIAKGSKIITFSQGDHITTEKDVMKNFYVVMYGTATVFVNNQVVGDIHSGECIGEGAFFSAGSLSRSATVIADGEVIAVEMSQNYIDAMEGQAQAYMNKALLLALYKKLKAANKKIEGLMRDK